ncbi:hypothetical protein BC936DRAFT_146163 [Jimgerdemannia flammicorona]|uniref:Uncharacterized protein n=1 Tax=Jimgerdemannia flammicorona TaxID=994334 RepID=A0A433D863_9FUNG|nr:hypothetical protein BC936DRAFT_146163 [Jimgerdemannia flammicorona]
MSHSYGFCDCHNHHQQVHRGRTEKERWTDEMVAGSAAYQALCHFSSNRTGRESHEQAKEEVARVAAQEADRLCEQKGLDHGKRDGVRRMSVDAAKELYFDTNEYRGDS